MLKDGESHLVFSPTKYYSVSCVFYWRKVCVRARPRITVTRLVLRVNREVQHQALAGRWPGP